tara:strand:+ start:197 stop:748 length:552 start_codon:yes stop_codon:yes gene_type:complete
MNTPKKLIIYNFEELFNILNEIKSEFNYEIEKLNNNNLENKVFDLLLSRIKVPNVENQLVLNEIPLKITKLIEKINIEILKNNFHSQSEVLIGVYKLNLNSRELFHNNIRLKLTEKETNIIIYLSKFENPISVTQLQNNVWGYQSDLDTHTVETHIYRLRKKISEKFSDENFIKSEKDGYKIS